MAKEKPRKDRSAGLWQQSVLAANVAPAWTNYWNAAGCTSPNIAWQGTTSGATYSAASSVLKP